jgi:hypothetical protein
MCTHGSPERDPIDRRREAFRPKVAAQRPATRVHTVGEATYAEGLRRRSEKRIHVAHDAAVLSQNTASYEVGNNTLGMSVRSRRRRNSQGETLLGASDAETEWNGVVHAFLLRSSHNHRKVFLHPFFFSGVRFPRWLRAASVVRCSSSRSAKPRSTRQALSTCHGACTNALRFGVVIS